AERGGGGGATSDGVRVRRRAVAIGPPRAGRSEPHLELSSGGDRGSTASGANPPVRRGRPGKKCRPCGLCGRNGRPYPLRMNTPPPDPNSDSPKPSNRSALLIVWLVVFIDLLGFGIVLPVMPRQAEPYLSGLTPELRGATLGILFPSFSLMQLVFSPVWGRISDRIGRRPVLLISLLGSVIFYALYGFAVTLPGESAALAIGLMLAARVGAGIAGASVGTAAAVIAHCTPPERRAKGMALIGIAFGAGFTLGPLIAYFGLALFEQKPWGVGVLASGLSAIALFIAIAIFKETQTPNNKAGKDFFSLSRTA